MKVRKVKRQDNAPELEPPSSSALPDAAVFLLVSLSIIFFGLIVLYSTSFVVTGTGYFTKQLMWMGVGLAGFAAVVLIGYRTMSNLGLLWMIAIACLLTLALCFDPIKGARRWIRFGGFSLQPSEYVKVTMVLFLAWFLSTRTRVLETHPFLKVFVPGGIVCGGVIMLVLAGKDLGTTALLGVVFLIMMFVSGMKMRYILPPILLIPPIIYFLIHKFDPERLSRLTTFLNPELTQKTDGYQLWHSMLALGSGNWFGLGFTESRLKLKYLPESHTDFILAIVGEELGFISLCAVLVAYLLFIISGLRISSKARTRQGMLVAFGMISFIAVQAIINVGVISAAFPTKGMPAPMISYGGSNLVACMLAIGCVFSVALDNTFPDYQDDIRARILKALHLTRKKNAKKGSSRS